MARGWESKSVESQMEAAEDRASAKKPALTSDQLELSAKRQSLELTRTRVLSDLQTACNARYRAQLHAALRHVETQIAELPDSPPTSAESTA